MYEPSPEAIEALPVSELRLCEVPHLQLRPNRLYIFTVDPTCDACRKAAANAAPEGFPFEMEPVS